MWYFLWHHFAPHERLLLIGYVTQFWETHQIPKSGRIIKPIRASTSRTSGTVPLNLHDTGIPIPWAWMGWLWKSNGIDGRRGTFSASMTKFRSGSCNFIQNPRIDFSPTSWSLLELHEYLLFSNKVLYGLTLLKRNTKYSFLFTEAAKMPHTGMRMRTQELRRNFQDCERKQRDVNFSWWIRARSVPVWVRGAWRDWRHTTLTLNWRWSWWISVHTANEINSAVSRL